MKGRKNIQNFALEAVTFAYEEDGPVFQNVSLELPTAKAVWVRSPGGRGKSTLLKILSGLLTPQSGRYLINGENVSDMSFEEFLPYRLNMGYSFDMGGLLNNRSLAENLLLPLQYHKLFTPNEAFERVHQVTENFGMHETRDLRPFAVPGSQRKLTCVIRALIHSPQVAFLDDPLTGLKQDNLNDLFHFVEEAYANRSLRQIFFTSENPELARRFDAVELLMSADWFTMRGAA
jgi:ABC-type lipoprotein export system ATPase subunit